MLNIKLENIVKGQMTKRLWLAMMLIGIVSIGTTSQSVSAMQKVNDTQLSQQMGGSDYYNGACETSSIDYCRTAVLTCTQNDGIQRGQETTQAYHQDFRTTNSPSRCDTTTPVYQGQATCEMNAIQMPLYTEKHYQNEVNGKCPVALYFGTDVSICQRYQCAYGSFRVP